jgi:hypothetical protein
MVKFNKKLCSTDEVMQHANQEAQIVFPFGRVLDVLVVFCSQCVPIKYLNGSPSEFPKMSQIAPHFYSLGQRGGIPSFNTNFYFGKPPKFQGYLFIYFIFIIYLFILFWVTGQSKWIITNQKKKVELWMHPHLVN